VSPGQIEALVPASISPANQVYFATIQVTNNNSVSNPVTVYTANTAPGVFALAGDGIGPAAAQDANAGFTTIGTSNPANISDTIVVYETGLGAVSPSVPVGAAAPSNTLSYAVAPVQVDFGGVEASQPGFAGLTPTTAGLYQIDVAIPAGAGSGPTYFDVGTPDAYTSMATIDILGSNGSARALKTRPMRRMRPPGAATTGARDRAR
jgi:uncharacterized protein (TIGR03437 family)